MRERRSKPQPASNIVVDVPGSGIAEAVTDADQLSEKTPVGVTAPPSTAAMVVPRKLPVIAISIDDSPPAVLISVPRIFISTDTFGPF